MSARVLKRFALIAGPRVNTEPHVMLACPHCGDSNVHFDGPPYNEDGHDCGDAPHGLGNRGDTVVVPLIGECGHAWNMVLGFHKGSMLLACRDVRRSERLATQR